jgi:AraC family transcriptional activator of mar-sox-rob regulon
MFWTASLTLSEPSPVHAHDVIELIFCLAGSGSLLFDQQSIDLAGRRTILIAPGVRHRFTFRPGESADLKVVCLTLQDTVTHLSSAQTAILGQVKGVGATFTDHPEPSPLWGLIETIPDGLGQEDHGQLLVVWSTIALLLSSHLRNQQMPEMGQEARHVETIRRVCAWLDQHLENTGDLDEIASRFGLSRSLLTLEFRRQTSTSVISYINTRRLQKAGRLLVSGRGIAEASYDSGFASLANFYRRFKRLYGVTPAEFQKQSWHPSHGNSTR